VIQINHRSNVNASLRGNDFGLLFDKTKTVIT